MSIVLEALFSTISLLVGEVTISWKRKNIIILNSMYLSSCTSRISVGSIAIIRNGIN